jgi:uncharacterized membrane protein YfcA
MEIFLDYSLILVFVVIFIASLTRSTFGFGDALIAMPLLALFISIKTATPVVAVMGLTISIAILYDDWRHIRLKSIWVLVLFSLIGIPIGLIFLKGAAEDVVKITLSVVLIVFGTYKLLKPDLFVLRSRRLAFLFGLISGILGGAYNTNGPPIIIYGTLRQWKPEMFRAVLQGVFLPTNFFIIIGHGIAGLWTKEVWHLMIFSLPIIFLSIMIGNRLNKKIPSKKFSKYIFVFLILIGFVLLFKVVL